MLYRGDPEYRERRRAVNDAGKIRVKIPPGGQYLVLGGAEVVQMLEGHAKRQGRCARGRVVLAARECTRCGLSPPGVCLAVFPCRALYPPNSRPSKDPC